MDRNSSPSPGVLAAKPNRRKPPMQSSANPRISRTAPSKPQSNNDKDSSSAIQTSRTKENLPPTPTPAYRRSSSSLSAASIPESPRDTRIPRPKPKPTPLPSIATTPRTTPRQRSHTPIASPDMRQPMTFSAAFALAERQEEEDEQTDSTGSLDIKQAFRMASAEIDRVDGSPSPAPRIPRAVPQRSSASRRNSDLNQHLQQFDRLRQLKSTNGPPNGLFTQTRVGPKVSETGHALAKKTSNGSLGGSPSTQRANQWSNSPKSKNGPRSETYNNPVARRTSDVPDAKDVPVPSIEYHSPTSDERPSPISRPSHPSPDKSYNWHLDAEFTAGDLQVSDSPRVQLGVKDGPSPPRTSPVALERPTSGTPNNRRANTRLTEIRAREIAAEKAVPSEPSPSPPKRLNTKLDEVRRMEMEALSRRAVATSRLDEIKIKNSEARSTSPEERRISSRDDLRGDGWLHVANPHGESPQPSSVPESKTEAATHSQVTAPRNISPEKWNETAGEKAGLSQAGDLGHGSGLLGRNDSHDLLRRLERAVSSSPPAMETRENGETARKTQEESKHIEHPPQQQVSASREASRPRLTRDERRSRNLGVKSSRERPTVGFAGLRRDASSDSLQEKRSSRPTSEIDPTDRIEAEMKLFAPMDNYSEKGSIRAPSPDPSEVMEEETPRPVKIDPMTLPTPRVTGAYVETPATIKVKTEEPLEDKRASGGLLAAPELRRAPPSRNLSHSRETQSSQSEDKGRPKMMSTSEPRSSSVPASLSDNKSHARRRRPLINTANPPSVKEDIRSILRMNQIDDSTLEDFDSLLANHKFDDEELEQMVNDTVLKMESDDLDFSDLPEHERELRAYDRMSKTLKTGLMGIRSAKKGIERLEDKVTHTEQKADPHPADPAGLSSDSKPGPDTARHQSLPDGLILRIPPLYRRQPKFRLTTFGLLSLLFTIWYILESVFCHFYEAQECICTPQVPCDWSPNEPYFPYTMPFMLDEWATRGKGRALVWRTGEEVGDLVAEVLDWITNTDFTKSDPMYMDIWERQRFHRRLRKHKRSPKWSPPPGYQMQAPAWEAAKQAREEARELGLEDEDESMSADEMVH
ncbi:hypothetical protein F4778DRAFT_733364 [Xylariomycetidae sp. FL2044]|nr:hypothetical protein F4778DRAFT_733364 [Xylariomycetidae sp. FL2044]